MDPFIGEIRLLPFNRPVPPQGWFNCDGSAQPIHTYAALYALIGGLYGPVTQTTFTLPNLQGHAPVGSGQGPGLSPRTLGQNFGAEVVQLSTAEIPVHTHALNGSFQTDSAVTLTANPVAGDYFTYPGYTAGTVNWNSNSYDSGSPTTTLAPGTLALAGSGQPHENRQPFLVLRWCICWEGTFPERP